MTHLIHAESGYQTNRSGQVECLTHGFTGATTVTGDVIAVCQTEPGAPVLGSGFDFRAALFEPGVGCCAVYAAGWHSGQIRGVGEGAFVGEAIGQL
nr:hypothetical protein [Kibdelosporangium sp. MJ126-NF4]